MEGKEWRIKKVERRTHYIGNTRGSVETSEKGRFENMKVDRGGGLCAFGQVFAHADLVRCTWSLRLYRYKAAVLFFGLNFMPHSEPVNFGLFPQTRNKVSFLYFFH